jgi:predicted MPP superfamily phosphohydrolase
LVRFSSPHAADLTVAAAVIVTQVYLGRIYFREWQPRLPKPWAVLARTVLWTIWILSGIGIFFDVLGVRYRAGVAGARFRSLAVGVEILWGFITLVAMSCFALYRLISRRRPNFSPARRRLLRAATAAGMMSPFAVVGFGTTVGRTRYQIREIDLPVPNLHPDFNGFRVAQISDLHVSPFLSVAEAGRVVDMTNELRPELVFVTGDLISDSSDPLFATIAELARLRASEGILGCHGNHEVYAECEDLASDECARFGIRILRHENAQIRRGQGVLNVAGVDFQRFANRSRYLLRAQELVLPGAANILLSHNPDVFPVAVRKGFDTVLAGHTHGGQVTVEIVNQTLNVARFFTPYVSGLYRLDGRSCYVNAGIGTIGMPVRVGAPPEISLFRLVRA